MFCIIIILSQYSVCYICFQAKIITKASLPEYLITPSARLREGQKVVVQKTEVFVGECATPVKKMTLEVIQLLNLFAEHSVHI